MPSFDLERLGKTVKARRLELGLGVEPAARKAKISKDTWKRVEGTDKQPPQPVREMNYAKVDKALSWAVGSCEAIALGGDPILATPTPDGEHVEVTIPMAALASELKQAITDATMVVTPDLTVREIHALNDQVIEELRKRGILPSASE